MAGFNLFQQWICKPSKNKEIKRAGKERFLEQTVERKMRVKNKKG
ncbi:MAG TPA: hypothetical protein ACFYD1_06640 [Candidatus Hypogeohydataceae bacterium YC38]|nr:hypothetical protein [Candidatus Brocadiales bacterium]